MVRRSPLARPTVSATQMPLAGLPETPGGRPGRRGIASLTGPGLPFVSLEAGVDVVRDDVLPGGTLARAAWALIRHTRFTEVVYAATGRDPTQFAVAYWARIAGKRATIFIEQLEQPHAWTLAAFRAGAVITPIRTRERARAAAARYAAAGGCALLPELLDDPLAANAIASAARSLEILPQEVWTAERNGVVTRGLQLAWPYAKHVVVLVAGDGADIGTARRIVESLPIHHPPPSPPPFPADPETSAKAWTHLQREAESGALLWNVL